MVVHKTNVEGTEENAKIDASSLGYHGSPMAFVIGQRKAIV